MFVLALVVFATGYRWYIHVLPQGSIYMKSISCVQYALKRNKTIKHINVSIAPGTSFPFLEFAKPAVDESAEDINKRSWTPEFPNELREAFKACTIFPLMTVYWVAYSQMTNNLVSQAGEMMLPSWLPNDLVSIIDVFFI
jgi:dipeptide/tripeptide permease